MNLFVSLAKVSANKCLLVNEKRDGSDGRWRLVTDRLNREAGESQDYSGEYKDRGNDGTWKLIEEHWDEIVEYVNSNGGFIASINSAIADEVAE